MNKFSCLSPTPAYSDKFGTLKKSEALEVLFNNLNRQLKAMKTYFSSELEIVAAIDSNIESDEYEYVELRKYVKRRQDVKQ